MLLIYRSHRMIIDTLKPSCSHMVATSSSHHRVLSYQLSYKENGVRRAGMLGVLIIVSPPFPSPPYQKTALLLAQTTRRLEHKPANEPLVGAVHFPFHLLQLSGDDPTIPL